MNGKAPCISASTRQQPVVYKEDYTYEIGKSITVRRRPYHADCYRSIVFYVSQRRKCWPRKASGRESLKYTIKPLKAVIKAAKETGAIVTAEDHNIYGGLSGAVAEVLAEEGLPAVQASRYSRPLAGYGEPEYLYHLYGYDAEGICSAIKLCFKLPLTNVRTKAMELHPGKKG